MKRLKLFILLLIPFGMNAQKECKITYIANTGFMIESAQKKILIDAFFNPINEGWCDSPTPSMIEKMNNASPPFDQVDIIAITHNHRDHFSIEPVIRYLKANNKTKVTCPEQVTSVFRKHPYYSQIENRIVSIDIKPLQDTTFSVKDINIRAVRLEHSIYMIPDTIRGELVNKHRNITNLGYVFNIQGLKVFHCGDTNPINTTEYKTYALNKEGIHIGFLERMFFSYGTIARDVLHNDINPEEIIIMHIGPNSKEEFKKLASSSNSIHVFNQMETKTFNFEIEHNLVTSSDESDNPELY